MRGGKRDERSGVLCSFTIMNSTKAFSHFLTRVRLAATPASKLWLSKLSSKMVTVAALAPETETTDIQSSENTIPRKKLKDLGWVRLLEVYLITNILPIIGPPYYASF